MCTHAVRIGIIIVCFRFRRKLRKFVRIIGIGNSDLPQTLLSIIASQCKETAEIAVINLEMNSQLLLCSLSQICNLCPNRIKILRMSPILINQFDTTRRHYAAAPAKAAAAGAGITGLGSKKKIVKAGPTLEKKILPVETDPERLVNYVCGSCITKEGEDIKLKPDNEYPEWLWNLRTGPPPPLNELDPDTQEYWDLARKHGLRQMRKLMKLKKF